jgi:glycosyltransferase involved in cell wall biosynthesis
MKLEGNILILTQWSFKDALVQTYTLPYISIIREIVSLDIKIILVTSEQPVIALNKKEIEAINKEWKIKNLQIVAQSYRKFGLQKVIATAGQLFSLYRIIKKEKIKIIHAFCTPAGGIAYLLSKITGAKLVLDSYEPHAEAMVETGTWKRNSFAFRLLYRLEMLQSKSASVIIAATNGMKVYAKGKYGVELKNFFVKPACIDFQHFYPRKKDEQLQNELELTGKLVCVYAGKLGGTYLKDEVFDFIKSCYSYWGDKFRFLMLSSESNEQISKQIKRIQIPAEIVINKFIWHKDMPRYLSTGDFAINPQVPVPSKKFGTPIKNGEYWAMGLPIVISPGISEDSDIILQNEIGVVINLKQIKNHYSAVKLIDELLKNNDIDVMKKKIFDIAKKYRSFIIAENVYKEIYGNDTMKS